MQQESDTQNTDAKVKQVSPRATDRKGGRGAKIRAKRDRGQRASGETGTMYSGAAETPNQEKDRKKSEPTTTRK